jgi:hypothetical protein
MQRTVRVLQCNKGQGTILHYDIADARDISQRPAIACESGAYVVKGRPTVIAGMILSVASETRRAKIKFLTQVHSILAPSDPAHCIQAYSRLY